MDTDRACTVCGTMVADDQETCPNCGRPLDAGGPSETPPGAPQPSPDEIGGG